MSNDHKKSFPQHPVEEMTIEALREEVAALASAEDITGYRAERLSDLRNEIAIRAAFLAPPSQCFFGSATDSPCSRKPTWRSVKSPAIGWCDEHAEFFKSHQKRRVEMRPQPMDCGKKEMSDTERLNWLSENFGMYSFRYSPLLPTMNNSHPQRWFFWSQNEGRTSRLTLREAIDEAMRPAETKLQPLTKNDQRNQ